MIIIYMKVENCIQVKHVIDLSVAYLSRFFGSAGTIKKIEKDEISRYVTIQYQQRMSVDKAMRFNGRVLDKHPIKIKKYQKDSSQITLTTIINLTPQNTPIIALIKQESNPKGSFQERLWALIVGQLKTYQEEKFLCSSFFLWALGDNLMKMSHHIKSYGVNLRSSYCIIEIQKQILQQRRQRKYLSQKVWFEVPYPNIQEEQCKIQNEAMMPKCLQAIETIAPLSAHNLRHLYAASLILNHQEHSSELIQMPYPTETQEEDNWQGFVNNIGIRDICFDLLSLQQPNTCIYRKQKTRSSIFSCSLRLSGCLNEYIQERPWCDYYQAILKKRWLSPDRAVYVLKVKEQIQKISLAQQNLFFQQCQFSVKDTSAQAHNFSLLSKSSCKVIYLRRKLMEVQRIYQDQKIQIDQEICHYIQKQQPYQQETILNLTLIQLRPNAVNLLNELKLSNYLSKYIDNSIAEKGLIIASRQMADKLAENIIEMEKQSRLFEFASGKHVKHIAEELWRLYNNKNQRKIKYILGGYKKQNN